MGLYDTIRGWINCNKCDSFNVASFEYNKGEGNLAFLSIGSVIDDHKPYHSIDQTTVVCEVCNHSFKTHVIAHGGVILGCMTDDQYVYTESFNSKDFTTITISKEDLQENKEKVIREFTQLVENESISNYHYISTDKTEIATDLKKICAIPIGVSDPTNRPKIGEMYFVRDENKLHTTADSEPTQGTVINRVIDKQSGYYIYAVQFESDTTLHNVHELNLIPIEESDAFLKQKEDKRQTLLRAYELYLKTKTPSEEEEYEKKKTAFFLFSEEMEELKDAGDIPINFDPFETANI